MAISRPLAPRHALALSAAAAAALLGLVAVASSLHGASKTALLGGIQFGGAPPEGVLDDLMNNVDPSDPYGGPVWGTQSGDIGSTYEYAGQPLMLAGQNQMPESWVTQRPGHGAAQPMVMEPNSGNLQYIPNPHAAKHHEQPPIYFGSKGKPVALKQQPAAVNRMTARTMQLASFPPTAASEMQKWGWPSQQLAGQQQQPESWTQQRVGVPPVVVQQNAGPLKRDAKARATQSKMQKLWMFNMGYEHHEQPPIYFGSARKEDNIVV